MRHQLQLEIGHSSDYWARGFFDGFDSIKAALSIRYPDLKYTGISAKKLSAEFNQPASQPGTPVPETSLPLFNPSSVLVNPEASPSLEIMEKDQRLLRADPKRIGENAPDPTLSPSSLPEVIGPKGSLMASGDNLPLS